uniref:RLA class II histocompatibility antigen, DP alpha-1 chain-like n=1 Tax=Mastacembelus armatus TaxID=205130 RepID=A0A7N8WS77_9TELE
MKVKVSELVLVLVLSWVPSVSGQHEDIGITGCSDSDGEELYALDGEELWYADFVNKRGVEPQPSFIDHMSYEEGAYEGAVGQQQICKQNLKADLQSYKNPPLQLGKRNPPSSPIIYSRDDVELDQQNTLICHVTGFYPAPVKIQWTKNGQKVTEGTSINVPFPNKDGSFRQTSRLEFTPQLGDVYSCTVNHPALDQSLTRIWADVEVSVQQPSVGPAVFCGLGLTVGLLGVAAGTFFLIKGNECS